MNQAIAIIIRDEIKSLPFMDKVAGMVQPLTFSDEKGKRLVIPVSTDVCFEDCKKGKGVEDLVPDSSKRSVCYFEDLGISSPTKIGAGWEYTSNLKLVCWLNLKKLGRNDHSVSGEAISAIQNAIPTNFFNSGIYTRINIEISGIDAKTPSIFSKYTYSDKIQYLMHPYDYFAINLKTVFRVPNACVETFTTGGSDQC